MKNKFLALLTVLAVFGFTAISAQAQPLHNQPAHNGGFNHNGFNHYHNHYHTGYYNNGYWYGPSAPGITLQFSF